LILEGMPDIYRVYVDDVVSTDYTYVDGTFTISMRMSEHEILLDFSQAEGINAVTNLMITAFVPMVAVVAIISMLVKGLRKVK
jgi:hypothetical protein